MKLLRHPTENLRSPYVITEQIPNPLALAQGELGVRGSGAPRECLTHPN